MTSQQGEDSTVKPTHEGFYRAFEDCFRGSRELILSRLKAYLPFIEPLGRLYPVVPAVDLGCGRGEWLELLRDIGFEGQGVDTDAGMLLACQQRGLHVTQGDAIEFLKALPGESQAIVSGFHLAEHIPFAELQTLIQEALRVLKPAGLLILETPNPENFKVALTDFYLDPSHRNPLPPLLLGFAPKYYGFERVKIVRLQEQSTLLNSEGVSLEQALYGASPDYAVVSQKHADASVVKVFDDIFEREFGISASTLLLRYDSNRAQQEEKQGRLQSHMNDLEGQLGRVEGRLGGLESKLVDTFEKCLATFEAQTHQITRDARRIIELEARISLLDAESEHRESALVNLRGQLQEREASSAALERDHHWLQGVHQLQSKEVETLRQREGVLDQEVTGLRAELNLLYRSRSWRLTAPLRYLTKRLHRASRVLRRDEVTLQVGGVADRSSARRSLPRRAARHVLVATVRLVRRNQTAMRVAKRLLARFPSLRERLEAFRTENAPQTHRNASGLEVTQQQLSQAGQSPAVHGIYGRMQTLISSLKSHR